MYIENVTAEKLPIIVAGLVREGVTFRATPDDDSGKTYTIQLTGGH